MIRTIKRFKIRDAIDAVNKHITLRSGLLIVGALSVILFGLMNSLWFIIVIAVMFCIGLYEAIVYPDDNNIIDDRLL